MAQGFPDKGGLLDDLEDPPDCPVTGLWFDPSGRALSNSQPTVNGETTILGFDGNVHSSYQPEAEVVGEINNFNQDRDRFSSSSVSLNSDCSGMADILFQNNSIVADDRSYKGINDAQKTDMADFQSSCPQEKAEGNTHRVSTRPSCPDKSTLFGRTTQFSISNENTKLSERESITEADSLERNSSRRRNLSKTRTRKTDPTKCVKGEGVKKARFELTSEVKQRNHDRKNETEVKPTYSEPMEKLNSNYEGDKSCTVYDYFDDNMAHLEAGRVPGLSANMTDFSTTLEEKNKNFQSGLSDNPNSPLPGTPNTAKKSCFQKNMYYPWRGRGKRRAIRMVGMAVVYVFVMTAQLLHKQFQVVGDVPTKYDSDNHMDLNPNLQPPPPVQMGPLPEMEAYGAPDHPVRMRRALGVPSNKSDCDIFHQHGEHFPADYLGVETTKKGGWVLHLFIALYTFAAIAGACDNYFVPALEHICEDLHLEADVAGATFMAAASSAPEFCTSVIGVFVAKSDVGLSAIVGSSVFNLLFIVGACAIFAGMPVQLSWYPLTRDSIFYLISVGEMAFFIQDSVVTWVESLIMILTYVAYVIVMAFNSKLQSKANDCLRRIKPEDLEKIRRSSSHRLQMMEARTKSRISSSYFGGKVEDDTLGSVQKELSKMGLSQDVAMQLIHENVTFGEMERKSSLRQQAGSSAVPSQVGDPPNQHGPTTNSNDLKVDGSPIDGAKIAKVTDNVEVADEAEKNPDTDETEDDEYENPLDFPDGCLLRMYWILMLPVTVMHAFTIPDTRIPGGWQARFYLLSFVLCIGYIVAYSYLMVWMVELVGKAFDIPTTVTGLTILAAGTSVPDCLSSIFVARDGYGDMAISNAIGSNVFDILLCLGIPWLIDNILAGQHGAPIDSNGLFYAVLSLILTVVYLIGSMRVVDWTLTFTYGIVIMIVYFLVITVCILIETNTLFQLNDPPAAC